ncbi:MAG: tRNA (guanosine(37)-N1)-methyltransferase TrmD [Desulfovibrio sp.]|nr:tRNA (guanosine(37)-N1)-methyltransferase TrmD [Desulfovibrio sp.]
MLQFHLITLFPEFFTSPLSCGLMNKAKAAGIVDFHFYNPRTYTQDRHGHVDDTPYGGGPGMVMRVQPVVDALRSIPRAGRILNVTPRGKLFTQEYARSLANAEDITIICGRYEGIDERIHDFFPIEDVCLFDAVLNSGDAAALAIIEALARLQPGFMGKLCSKDEESFSDGLLEYPHYTMPEEYEKVAVPDILRSGHHQKIAVWRRNESLARTRLVRCDLLAKAKLQAQDTNFLQSMPLASLGRNLSLCLVHHPVRIEGKVGTSSLTNLDIHDISRISATYGLGPFYVVLPLAEQRQLLQSILDHWCRGEAGQKHADRAQALSLVRPVVSLEEAFHLTEEYSGCRAVGIASSAHWPKSGQKVVVPTDVQAMLGDTAVLLCFGTSQGLADAALDQCAAVLRPIRFLGYNHLSVRSAAAILVDRILGDFF